jgi:hypothetical protein
VLDVPDSVGYMLGACPAASIPGRRIPDAATGPPIEAIRKEDWLVIVSDNLDSRTYLDEVTGAIFFGGVLRGGRDTANSSEQRRHKHRLN